MKTNFPLLLLLLLPPGAQWNQASHWAWPKPARRRPEVMGRTQNGWYQSPRLGQGPFSVHPPEPQRKRTVPRHPRRAPCRAGPSILCPPCPGNNSGSNPSTGTPILLQDRSPMGMLSTSSPAATRSRPPWPSPADLQRHPCPPAIPSQD